MGGMGVKAGTPDQVAMPRYGSLNHKSLSGQRVPTENDWFENEVSKQHGICKWQSSSKLG
jgi:hypothetical protein